MVDVWDKIERLRVGKESLVMELARMVDVRDRHSVHVMEPARAVDVRDEQTEG